MKKETHSLRGYGHYVDYTLQDDGRMVQDVYQVYKDQYDEALPDKTNIDINYIPVNNKMQFFKLFSFLAEISDL